MKPLSLLATLSLATVSPLLAQNEDTPVPQNSVNSTVQNVANQIAPQAPRGSILRTSQGKTEITPVSPTGGLATNPAHAAGTVRTLDSSAVSKANGLNTSGTPNANAAFPNVATGTQLTEYATGDLKDPFTTDATTAGSNSVANAQRAANTFKIAGIIHSRGERIAAVRSTADKSIQYLSLNGDTSLRVTSAPDLKLTVDEINDGSIRLFVGETAEVVYIR